MPAPSKYSFDHLFVYQHLDPISNFFKNLHPNYITLSSIIPSIISLYYFKNKEYLLGFIFFNIKCIIDALDGFHARKWNKTSNFGDLLDHGIDLLYFFGLIYVFNNYYPLSTYQQILIMFPFFGLIIFYFVNNPYNPLLKNFIMKLHDNGILILNFLLLLMI